LQAELDGAEDPLRRSVSAAVTDAAMAKILKYARLLAIARAQHDHRLRSSYPKFRAVVVSTLGEFGIDTIEVQEFLLACYKRKLKREGDRKDGLSSQFLTAKFRNQMRIGLQIAVAKGCANMATRAGLPSSKKRQADLDPHRFAKPRQGKPARKGIRPERKTSTLIHQKGLKPPSISSNKHKPSTPAYKSPKRNGAQGQRSPLPPRTLGDFLKA
jgi:hypothetical protein